MRDVTVTAFIVALLPFILVHPYVGVLAWSWLSYMNPHKLTWGFAYSMPFAQIVAIATFISLVLSKEPKRIPINPLTIAWLLFILWMAITTVFAIYPTFALAQFVKVIKIQAIALLTLMLITDRKRLDLLIWVIVVSIGFYSVKGGIFTIFDGGTHRVFGPPLTFLAENNALGLATLMVMPLMNYLRTQLPVHMWWLRAALVGAMVMSAFSVLGSQSRGAFLSCLAVITFFWLKSRRKLPTAITLLILLPPMVLFMPESWQERISTIRTRTTATTSDILQLQLSAPIASRDRIGWWPNDTSAIGRVNAWNYAINVAGVRLTGAGYESWRNETFAEFAPIVEAVFAAHSIYFGVLGDHGWPGLVLFVTIFFMAWRSGTWLIVHGRSSEQTRWAADLARMVQVSLVAYASGGAFLSLSYFDLPWHLVAILVIARNLVQQQLSGAAEVETAQTPPSTARPNRFISPRPQSSPLR